MKRTIFFIISITLIFVSIILSKIYSYKQVQDDIKQFNLKYEQYINKEIYGRDIATIVNKAVDDNEKNYIKKDENGNYIRQENSVFIEIKITEFSEELIYTMETLYNGGMNEFVKYYGDIPFKSTIVEYNSEGTIKHILFEQIKL